VTTDDRKNREHRPREDRESDRGSKLLAGIKQRKRSKKSSPGQLSPWEEREGFTPEIFAVADKFVFANAYNPRIAGDIIQNGANKTV
jgi:putative transposase